jgi:exodeoxyribonuclease-3
MTLRVATWNINSVTARLPRLLGWLETGKPDVLCLQELKTDTETFPYDEVRELGYEAAAHGTGRWNGVAVLSRVGIADVVRDFADQPAWEGVTEPRAVTATCGPVRVTSVYVPNGREIDNPHYQYKLNWLQALAGTVRAEAAGPVPYAVLGDFNIAPTDDDVWDITLFGKSTHVTPAERAELDALRAAGTFEVIPRALKYDRAYTYWDYRQLAFPKNNGMRIDLVFANLGFADAVQDAYVDREERKGKGASDHAPVVVDLEV